MRLFLSLVQMKVGDLEFVKLCGEQLRYCEYDISQILSASLVVMDKDKKIRNMFCSIVDWSPTLWYINLNAL